MNVEADESAKFYGLTGKVAIVVGGSGGIGAATVALLRAAGASVFNLDITGPVEAPATECAGSVTHYTCDLRHPTQLRTQVEQIVADNDGVDIIVHCAGITRDAVLWKLSPESWNEVLDVNLSSAFHLLAAATPGLRKRGSGSIVLVTSINGERGKFGQTNYCASKAGLMALAKTAARELGRFGIRVNCIAPGFVETPMTAVLSAEVRNRAVEESALGRLTTAHDIAESIAFLASEHARQITGQTLRVDGGQHIA